MKWFIIIILMIVVLFIMIILSKLTVFIDYRHKRDDDILSIEFRALYGLIKYKLSVPVIKVDEESPTKIVVKEKIEKGEEEKDTKKDRKKFSPEDLFLAIKDANKLLNHVVGMYKVVRYFLKKVEVLELEWKTAIGTGDAASTGTLTGAFWAVKGSVIGLVSTLMVLKKHPKIEVIPLFQRKESQTEFKCMIQFRIGYAIVASFKLIKRWKGGVPNFQTKPLSVLSKHRTKSV